jgi:very-short-patch-repair endonuclease
LRQKMIWSFILDLYCSKLLLWIEVDWKIHEEQQTYDTQRDERLRHREIKIIRYRNEDIFCDLQWVYDDIMKELIIREKQLASCHPPW